MSNYDMFAGQLLDVVKECIKEQTKNYVQIKSAIVESVNPDKTVNIRFPENGGCWTKISNQSIYQDLQEGDEVKIVEQDGIYKNCWIIGVHRGNMKQNVLDNAIDNTNSLLEKIDKNNKKNINKLNKQINDDITDVKKNILNQETQISEINENISGLQGSTTVQFVKLSASSYKSGANELAQRYNPKNYKDSLFFCSIDSKNLTNNSSIYLYFCNGTTWTYIKVI